jgi:hypothetical protein
MSSDATSGTESAMLAPASHSVTAGTGQAIAPQQTATGVPALSSSVSFIDES